MTRSLYGNVRGWKRFQSRLESNILFAEDLPPQLTVHVASGHAAVGPSGEVLVYPGSILHFDCLYDRKHGNPLWNMENQVKRYPKGK
jgi:hypothetical protein